MDSVPYPIVGRYIILRSDCLILGIARPTKEAPDQSVDALTLPILITLTPSDPFQPLQSLQARHMHGGSVSDLQQGLRHTT